MVRRKIPIFKIIRKSKDKKPKYRKIKSIKDLIKNKRRRSLFCRENTQKEPREIQKNIQLTRKIQNQRNFEIHPLKNVDIVIWVI
ncbi:hypothetical protein HZS_689 [Henneguya salminicola]|nr:hypothetical protein HZS_689 [Henneguya salminicola]